MLSSNDQLLLYEYTELLIGNTDSFTTAVFGTNLEQNQKNAISIFKLAMNIFMETNEPYIVKKLLTPELIKKLKLEIAVKNIKLPPEVDPENGLEYIASLIYPSQIPYKLKDSAVSMYKAILDGRLKRFSRGYFDGETGRKRACYCFNYLLHEKFMFTDARDMYEYFGSKQGSLVINQNSLKQALINYYDSAIELLHDTLSEVEKDEFWYIYYLVLKEFVMGNDVRASGYNTDLHPELVHMDIAQKRERRRNNGTKGKKSIESQKSEED